MSVVPSLKKAVAPRKKVDYKSTSFQNATFAGVKNWKKNFKR